MEMKSKNDAEKQLSALNKELIIQWEDNVTGTIWYKGVEYAGTVSVGNRITFNLLRKFQPDEKDTNT